MGEVLTRVDPDDSIEKFKSERRAMKVQTSDSGRRFVDTRELIKGEMAQGQHENAGQVTAERARLERLVIEAAKAYGRAARAVEDHMKKANEADDDSRAGWQLLRDMESTQEDLMLEAVWPLIDFESQIKK